MGIHERKEREKEQRREEIIAAAQKVFFEKGLQSSTMDDIAEAAELSKGTLYLYYKSKEDLYLAVMICGMEILAGMFEKVINSGEAVIGRMMKLGEAYEDFFRTHRNFFRMFRFFENPLFHTQVTEEMNQLCQTSNQKIWASVIGLIEQGIKQGLIRSDLTAAETGVILWSNSNALMYRLDVQEDHWKTKFGVDLNEVLHKSNTLLLESILTEKGKEQYRMLMQVQPSTN
jgi:TetR/AcrR family transcriptional regulator